MSTLVKRDVLRNSLKRLLTASKKTNTYDEAELQSFRMFLDDQWSKFDQAQTEVECSCGDSLLATEEAQREQVEEWYHVALSNFMRQQQQLKSVKQDTKSETIVTQHADVRLPPMDLPKFSGNPSEWKEFHDAFLSIMGNPGSLSGSQKLHYLRCSLRGEALKVIKAFHMTDDNYEEAWSLLKKRYNVERVIVDTHFRALFSLPRLANESSIGIRALLDNTQEHFRSLKTLGRRVENWDDWLVHLTVSKLDQETHRQWELSLEDDKVPSFEKLVNFLETRCRSLDAISSYKPSNHQTPSPAKPKNKVNSAFTITKKVDLCPICAGKHKIYICDKFRAMSVEVRVSVANEKTLCINCLTIGHLQEACRSTNTCRLCRSRHHTLLHLEQPSSHNAVDAVSLVPSAANASANVCPQACNASTSYMTNTDQQILLGTAVAKVKDITGLYQTVRILFDNGSHLTFISQACVDRLQLRIMSSRTAVEGIGAVPVGHTKGAVEFGLASLDNSFFETIHADILPRITTCQPPTQVRKGAWEHINGLNLADPNYNVPAAVDILLGCDQLELFLLDGLIRGPHEAPIAQNSTLGWVLFGRVVASAQAFTTFAGVANASLTKTVTKFWELEEIPESKHFTDEELMCEELFDKTHFRQDDGRYVVKLPFKPDIPLGSSRDAAVRSLLRMEKVFARDQHLHAQYAEFIQEFVDLGHAEPINEDPIPGRHFYMPHRAVIKESSSTTKLRVVFNASAKTSSGFSLNDAQLVGPQLQPDLYTTLLRFRSHRYAMVADVAKMYRQIRVDKSHIDYQRIVWRQTPAEPIKDFRLLTVTYGVASASHLAVKSLFQTAIDEKQNYPAVAAVVHRDFYMDDLLTGSYDEIELHRLQVDITSMLSRGGFQLRKWSSNSKLVLKSIPTEHRELKQSLDLTISGSVKTLGLQWRPQSDHFAYDIQVHEVVNSNITKRSLLSEAAKLFDPLGLLSPTTIIPKIMFQQLWRPKVDWDEPVPRAIKHKWLQYSSDLPLLAAIHIPRWIGTGDPEAITHLHGFADASQVAYAAAIYARTTSSSGHVSVRLLTAKTKVAPLNTISLPRLELCATLLLARLMSHVRKALEHTSEVYGWTDSAVAIAWIHQHPSKWCTFVGNRVSRIQECIPASNWFHVPSSQNPADCASRGLSPRHLKEFSLWWDGPQWLKEQQECWPPQQLFLTALDQKCNTVSSNVGLASQPIWSLINRYSSLSKLKLISVYILRFVNNIRRAIIARKNSGSVAPNVTWKEALVTNKEARSKGFAVTATPSVFNPSIIEFREALNLWIRLSQQHFFHEDIRRLQSKRSLSRQSSLLKLNPFLDDNGILRVGGRLRHASVQTDKRHPILLPAAARITFLICEDVHRLSLHSGPQTMQSILQGRFWIVNGRKLLRKIYGCCIKCRRYQHIVQQQLMSDLPKPRVQTCRPFLRSGVDFAGPVQLRFSKGRGSKAIKGYVAVFICMSTGAMHLELASDLSSSTFISVFKRFVSRRGHCSELYSDNGTNFVGAERELQSFLKEAAQNDQIAKYIINDGTTWYFNPPAAPHMGGYWEVAVKRVKFHLRRTLNDHLLTFEEFSTLLTEIEACVNSRPLCPISTDANDLQVLTPGHFLIGEPLKTIPEPDLSDVKVSLLDRWRLISQMRQHFWKRWSGEYLVRLQQRAKWTKSFPNVSTGDLVVLREDNIPPSKWKMARITDVHTGTDGRVRVVTLKTADGSLIRPIVKISPLLSFKECTTTEPVISSN